jgi:hypothetical protein
MYLAFSGGGLAALFFPSNAVAANVPSWMVYVWASFFIAGGLICSVGMIVRRWAGELVGLPLLASAATLYGVAVGSQFWEPSRHDGAYLFVAALLLAQAAGLLDRWVAQWRLLQLARRLTADGDR